MHIFSLLFIDSIKISDAILKSLLFINILEISRSLSILNISVLSKFLEIIKFYKSSL